MAGEGDGRGPEIIELSSVPGFVVFDLPGARAARACLRTRELRPSCRAETRSRHAATSGPSPTARFRRPIWTGSSSPRVGQGLARCRARGRHPGLRSTGAGVPGVRGCGCGPGLPMNAMRIPRAESVPGGTDAPAQRIEQNHGYQNDHRDRDRRREAENHDRELEQGRADRADHYRRGGAEESPLKHFAPLCALSALFTIPG